MLKEVTFQNGSGSQLTIPLSFGKNPFQIESIGGLGPVKASLVSTDFAQMDGSLYQSSRLDNRDISMQINLRPNFVTDTVASLRRQLYLFLMPKSKVRVFFKDALDVVYMVDAYVETCEPSLFSKETSMDVNLVCFDPHIREARASTFLGNTTPGTTNATIDYRGTAASGIKFRIKPSRALTDFSIYHKSSDGTQMQMDYQGPVSAGSTVEIVTTPGAKQVMMTDVGTGLTHSTLYYISPNSKWIQLRPGPNSIRVVTAGDPVPYTIEYDVKHGGL